MTTPGLRWAVALSRAGVRAARIGVVSPRKSSTPGSTQRRHVLRVSRSSFLRKAPSPLTTRSR